MYFYFFLQKVVASSNIGLVSLSECSITGATGDALLGRLDSGFTLFLEASCFTRAISSRFTFSSDVRSTSTLRACLRGATLRISSGPLSKGGNDTRFRML